MIITIKPKNKKELFKIKRILDAVEIDFIENDDSEEDVSDEEKQSIERGLKDAELGKFKPHSEVRKIYAKWL